MTNMTKQLIADKFVELLQSNSIDKITVKRLVEECGINRQTFYYHFADIYDLMDFIIRMLTESVHDSLQEKGLDRKEYIKFIFDILLANKKIVMHGYDPVNHLQYEQMLKEELRVSLGRIMEEIPDAEALSEKKQKFIINAYTTFFCSLIIQWMEDGMPEDFTGGPLDDYITLLDGTMHYAVEKFKLSE